MVNPPLPVQGQTTQDQTVATDGVNRSVSSSSSQIVRDPNTGNTLVANRQSIWNGRDLALDLIWFVVGIIALFLAGDFIFHLAGANDVGFVRFVYSVGSFFARPFAGIFNNASPNTGNLVVWADVLAVVVYAIIGAILAKLYTMLSADRATRTVR